MGYEVRFKGMSNEVMDKYNKKNKGIYGFSSNNEYRLSLKVYTLLKSEVSKDSLGRVPDVKNGVFNIKLYLAGLENEINQTEEQFAYDRWKEDNMLWYCGWEFSHDYCQHNRKDVYNYVIERLTILKFCAESGDYFDSESHFNDKAEDIDEVLAYFEDMMREIKIYEIMNELKEYRIPDDWDGTADEWLASKEKNNAEDNGDKEKAENNK